MAKLKGGFAREKRRRVQCNTNIYRAHDADVVSGKAKVGDKVPYYVKRAPADQCDIKHILNKYRQTGIWTHVSKITPQYGDLSELPDYQDAMNIVAKADEIFAALPAEIRDRFKNNPALMIEFMSEEKNFDEAVKLGLCKAKEPVASPVPPVPPVPPVKE